MNQRKLLLNERVEVRQFEEGLQGSWHPGVIVGVSDLLRYVEYDELLCEAGDSKLIESIHVTETIEGLHCRRHVPSTYRGYIRPLPPPCLPVPSQKLIFGICVDAFFEDAWWEGVILDCNDHASERSVFFPDEGDERKFSVNQLRVTRDWDEFLGVWRDRGVWTLVTLARELEGNASLSSFIKKVWFSLRLNYGFMKMISEWTCGARIVWKKYFMDVVYEIAVKTSQRNLANGKTLAWVVHKDGNKFRGSQHVNTKSHLSNSRTCPKGEQNARLGKCKRQKQSLKSKWKHEKQPVVNTADENNFLLRETQMTSGASCTKSKSTIFDDCDQITNSYNGRSTVNSTTLPTQMKQSGKTESIVDKLNSPAVCKREANLSKVDSSGEKNIVAFISHAQNNQLVKRSLTKQKKTESNISLPFPNCSKRQRSRNNSFSVVYKRRKCLTKRKRISKTCRQVNSKVKGPSMVEQEENKAYSLDVHKRRKHSAMRNKFSNKSNVKSDFEKRIKSQTDDRKQNAIGKEDDLFAGQRHQTLRFDNYRKQIRLKEMVSPSQRHKRKRQHHGPQLCDSVCSVCHSQGDLILCSHCPCSYHLTCIDLKDGPSGNWFCPSCRCGLCGLRDSNSENQQLTKACLQCNRQYHTACLNESHYLTLTPTDDPSGKFCSEACYKLCSQLHQLLGISNPTAVDSLSWTLLRSLKNVYSFPGISTVKSSISLSRVSRIIHECFLPVKDPHTKRDLVRDVVFSSASKLKRVDFRGFYTMVLHRGDEILSVATFRIHGLKAAEVPLIATPFQYRQQGGCRLLVNELEKLVTRMGVERLVLPAIPQLREIWETSFGFSEMPLSGRMEFLGYPFLAFQGTIMLQKFLNSSPIKKDTRDSVRRSTDTRGNKTISLVCKAGPDDKNKFYGLFYRRRKVNIDAKGDTANSCDRLPHANLKVYKRGQKLASISRDSVADRLLHTYQKVYMRRQKLASRDSKTDGLLHAYQNYKRRRKLASRDSDTDQLKQLRNHS